MRIEQFADFQRTGTAGLPAGGAYVSIASGSEVDMCRVGPNVLGVGQVVPFSSSVEAVRGIRGAATAPYLPVQDQGSLALAIWSACEVPIVGPRAPILRTVDIDGPQLAVSAAAAGVAPLLRLPFFGRRQAMFTMWVPAGVTINYVVRGLKFRDRESYATRTGDGAYPSAAETTPATYTPAASADGAFVLANAQNIGGGGDLQEGFDQLELYVWSAAAGVGHFHFEGEAFGERAL